MNGGRWVIGHGDGGLCMAAGGTSHAPATAGGMESEEAGGISFERAISFHP
jgi:hypothetical protein